jgi:hypothetical protein
VLKSGSANLAAVTVHPSVITVHLTCRNSAEFLNGFTEPGVNRSIITDTKLYIYIYMHNARVLLACLVSVVLVYFPASEKRKSCTSSQ